MANNYGFPNRETVERVRRTYPKGCRVKLVSMDDPYSRLTPGDTGTVCSTDDTGTVCSTDDTGTVFVNWDCGSSLGIVYGVDRIQKI